VLDAGDAGLDQRPDDLGMMRVGGNRNSCSAGDLDDSGDDLWAQRWAVRLSARFVQAARSHDFDDAGTCFDLFPGRP
jgi:hypothetical protein